MEEKSDEVVKFVTWKEEHEKILIEWADKFEEILPIDRIQLNFQIKSKVSRSVQISLRGKFKNQKY